MIEADRLLVLPFVVDIEQDMFFLDYGQIREINAGEGVRSDVPSGVFTYGDLIKVYPFENTLCILKINPSDYMFRYYSNNSLIKATYNDQMTPVVNEDGYVYIATIDYIAYQIGYPKEELFSYPELTCRDIVAENLRVLNEEGGSVI